MGLWQKVWKLLVGQSGAKHDGGLYFYIRLYKLPGRTSPDDEIVQLRIDPMNDISTGDDGKLFIRKEVVGARTFRHAEVYIYFNERRQPVDHQIDNGELVQKEAFDAYQAKMG